jgi:hypothetical protein
VLISLLFWMLTLLCSGYAVVFGGRDGRWAAFLLLAASGLSLPPTLMDQAYVETELILFAVDLLFLAGLYALMLTSGRFWPIWMTGFHLVVVVTHLSTMLVPDFTPRIYRAMASFWAIPITLTLLIGVELDRRAAWKTRASSAGAGEVAGHDS